LSRHTPEIAKRREEARFAALKLWSEQKVSKSEKKWFGSDEPSKVGIGILFMVEIGKLKLKEMGFNQQTNKGASREAYQA
jgi:phage major head subunit gpT-like protein